MSHQIEPNYAAQWLLPPSLEDFIGSGHPARFIREVVDALDLKGLGFQQRRNQDGRPSYAEHVLLKVWLYGYFNKIRSTRGLEQACCNDIGMLWLTGFHAPDHNTLWRFWRDNRAAIRSVFKSGLKIAMGANLVGLVLHAVDGTKIETAAAHKQAVYRKDLEKLLANLDALVEGIMKETEAAESSPPASCFLPERLQDAQKLRQEIANQLKQMDQQQANQRMPGDEESRMMKMAGNRKRFGYNAQVVVDDNSGLIVAQDVVNDQTDNYQLTPMIEQVRENLGAVAEETVADGGYRAPSELQQAEDLKQPVLVNLGESTDKKGAYSASQFVYDAERNHCICPRGEILPFFQMKQKDRLQDTTAHQYRCQSYKTCPVRFDCSKSKKGRTIEIYPAVIRQKTKQQDPLKKALLKKRGQIVERIFGWAKQGFSFRRWSVRGLDKTRTQWALLCTVLNLRVLYRHWHGGRLAFSA